MAKRDTIVIGGSAGALEALAEVVGKLPHDLAAAIFVVTHISPARESHLPNILTRAGRLRAVHPVDGQQIEYGQIYVAPPDRHLILENTHISLVHGPKENRARPAIDPLFRSAAANYGPRTIGVLLSGSLDDGTAGLRAIKQRGGLAVVQDPADASYPGMPESAIYNNKIDHVVKADEIARLLRQLVAEEISEEGVPTSMSRDAEHELDLIKQKFDPPEMIDTTGQLGGISMFTCPECQGTLWELKDSEMLRYRCHVGHAYSMDSLDVDQGEKLEGALWSALRALEERGALARRLAQQSRERQRNTIANRFEQRAREADENARSIRQILLSDPEKALTA
jgi:two-component system, chemotaxis family, protein-glutamate methylesterase/glutaminase